MNSGSAIVSFNGLDTRCGVIQIYARGHRENVRKALARACSHRRRLVTTRPSVFFLNATHALQSAVGSDNMDYLGPDRTNALFERMAPTVHWKYRIWMKDRIPMVTYQEGDNTENEVQFFQFLGMEYARPYEWTEARKKRRGGRPTGLRQKNPELFSNLKPKAVAKQQNLTSNAARDALDLKHKPRKIHVDFTGVESVDRTRGERISLFEDAIIDDELSSDSQQVPGAI